GVADRTRVFLLGFSQSCALNYRFAFTHPDVMHGVIGICGGLPGDWESSELYQQTKAAIFHLSGERDEYYPPARVAPYETQLRERRPVVCRPLCGLRNSCWFLFPALKSWAIAGHPLRGLTT